MIVADYDELITVSTLTAIIAIGQVKSTIKDKLFFYFFYKFAKSLKTKILPRHAQFSLFFSYTFELYNRGKN